MTLSRCKNKRFLFFLPTHIHIKDGIDGLIGPEEHKIKERKIKCI